MRHDSRLDRVLRGVDRRHHEHGNVLQLPVVVLVLQAVGVRGLRLPTHTEHLHLTFPYRLALERLHDLHGLDVLSVQAV